MINYLGEEWQEECDKDFFCEWKVCSVANYVSLIRFRQLLYEIVKNIFYTYK